MAGQHQAGLWSAPGGAVELPLSRVPRGSGRPEKADEGDRRDAGAVWLSPHPCAAPARGLGRERKTCLSALQGDGAAAAAQTAEASGEGEAERRTLRCVLFDCDVGYGLRP